MGVICCFISVFLYKPQTCRLSHIHFIYPNYFTYLDTDIHCGQRGLDNRGSYTHSVRLYFYHITCKHYDSTQPCGCSCARVHPVFPYLLNLNKYTLNKMCFRFSKQNTSRSHPPKEWCTIDNRVHEVYKGGTANQIVERLHHNIGMEYRASGTC